MNNDRSSTHPNARALRLLPTLLVTSRRRKGAPQKVLALDAGLNQSYVCALENGRRQVPRPEVLDALCTGLRLDEAERVELKWAAAHDRVLEALLREGLASQASLISAALRAAHYLLPKQLVALEEKIQRHARSGQELRALEAETAGLAKESEAAMA